MMGFLVAPTEPKFLKDRLGASSSVPEKYGADVLCGTGQGLVAIQRKELKDLVASMTDGRLGKEIAQMQHENVMLKVLVVEGRPQWSLDGELMVDTYHHLTMEQYHKYLYTVRSKGVWVETTANLGHTVLVCQWLEEWAKKDVHRALDVRPGPPKTGWGTVNDAAWRRHLLTSFEGIGPETADSIIAHFGGVPLEWTVTEEEMLEVEGVGNVRASKMMKALETARKEQDDE